MSRTRHHRRKPRGAVFAKTMAHRKPIKKSVQCHVRWPESRSFREEELIEQLVYSHHSGLSYWDYEILRFQPWHYSEVKPLLEKMTRLRGSPVSWYLGPNPPLPGWKERE